MASQTFDNGELLLDVRTKINTNFTTVDQRVDALELVVASLPTVAYQKPSEGIPSTDLSTEVQSALTEASTAFQKPVDGIPASDLDTATQGSIVNGDAAYQVIVDGISYSELTPSIVNTLAKADTAYQKPSLGIPKTDLAAAVQTSLTKADTAIQPEVLLGGISGIDFVTYDTTPETVPTAPGSVYWDSTDGIQTLNVVMAGNQATLQVGQESYYRVKAATAIRNGAVVMYVGAQGNSGVMLAAEAANIPVDQPHLILGIATHAIAAGSFGYVTWFGQVRGINTTGIPQGEVWNEGDILYFDPDVAGGLTNVRPPIPNPIALLVVVINVHGTVGSIFVRPQYGSTLGGSDGNVQFTNLQDKDFIAYDGVAERWENYTPLQTRGLLGLGDLATQSSSNLVVKPQAVSTPVSNGDMTFELTNNTTLTIKAKGSDGVVRSATLELT